MIPLIDRALLRGHDSFLANGIEERAFLMEVGDGHCFAIFNRPSDRAALSRGFVILHSHGDEFLNLRRMERAIGRSLARMGFPVLSFHRRGYGDSTGDLSQTTLGTQEEDIAAAIDQLRALGGVAEVGMVGVRLGALLTAAAVRGGQVDRLILVNPVFRSEPYFKGLMKQTIGIRLVGAQVAPQASVEEFLETLTTRGEIDLMGFPMYRTLYEDLAGLGDLASDVGSLSGRALVLEATRATSVRGDLAAFTKSVEGNGGECRVELVREPPGVKFGQKPFVFSADPTVFVDRQGPMLEDMAALVEGWAHADV
ncbi:MAG: alpha/beta fold hydrolase [Actinomycetota bacterium]